MNTKITYMYRDAGNYKFYQVVIITGVVSLKELTYHCTPDGWFIPHDVGLPPPEIPFSYRTEYDHPWHEFDTVESTKESPNIDVTADELLDRFAVAAKRGWDEMAAFMRMAL